MNKLYVFIQKLDILDGTEEFTYWPFMSIDLAETFMKCNKRDAKSLGVKLKQYLDIWEVSEKDYYNLLNCAKDRENILYKQETLWGDNYD